MVLQEIPQAQGQGQGQSPIAETLHQQHQQPLGPQVFPQRKRKTFTNSQKAALRARHQARQYKTPHSELAAWFQDTYKQRIDSSTISRILSPRYAWLDDRGGGGVGGDSGCGGGTGTGPAAYNPYEGKRRPKNWPELETALLEWVRRKETEGQDLMLAGAVAAPAPLLISQRAIREQARELWPSVYPNGRPMPSFSNGWLFGFQKRAGITFRAGKRQQLQGGSSPPPPLGPDGSAVAAMTESEDAALAKVRFALRGYQPQDIFNCDETCLYWRMVPDKSLAGPTAPPTMQRQQRSRFSLLLCCNSDGSERLAPLIIGSVAQPRSFWAARVQVENLGCYWRANRRAWMTRELFREWLLNFDRQMAGRKVALLLDTLAAHEAAAEGLHLVNTQLVWLPPAVAARYQPLSQGITKSFKCMWRKSMLIYLLSEYSRASHEPLLSLTTLQSIRWLIMSWKFELNAGVIANFFKRLIYPNAARDGPDRLELLTGINKALRNTYITKYIENPMTGEEFLYPPGEEVPTDSGEEPPAELDLDLGLDFDPHLYHDIDDDYAAETAAHQRAEEPLPLATASAALQHLYALRLYEEQQPVGDHFFIDVLLRYEPLIQKRNTVSLADLGDDGSGGAGMGMHMGMDMNLGPGGY